MKKLTLLFTIFMLNFFSIQLFAQEILNGVEVKQKFKHKKKYTYTNLTIKRVNKDTLVYSFLPLYENTVYNTFTERQNDYALYYKPTAVDGKTMVRVPDDSPREDITFPYSQESISFSVKYCFEKDNTYVERIFNPKTKQGIKITVYLPANSGIPIKERKEVTYKIEPITDFYQ